MPRKLEIEISKKRDEINSHYWRFTRQARGNPPPRYLYDELKALEDKMKKRKPASLTPARQASNLRNTLKRQKELDAKAQAIGWRGSSELITAMKRGDVEIPAVSDAVIIKRKTIGE